MEDADEEWKRSEYSGGWVMNRGLRLGKQFMVASLLASSAPLLLPALVVVSVIGISVSMPYGIFLATHACTHKLMSKLLPMPTPANVGKLEEAGEFEVANNVVALEEFESDDEDKETKGLLEKIRDEGTSDTRGLGVEGHVDDRNGRHSHTPIPRQDAHQSGFDLFKETKHIEPTVLYVQHKCTQFEYSSVEKDITSPSPANEVKVNEEKIRKEINAIKLIVGYEGTPQASCADELKNLYIFTGVEPPTRLNHSSNPLEINDKLHFLMSILGLKSSVP